MKPKDFSYRQFLPEVILQCLRWYLRYSISYRNLEKMMVERGVEVDHTTLYRWVQAYSVELAKKPLTLLLDIDGLFWFCCNFNKKLD